MDCLWQPKFQRPAGASEQAQWGCSAPLDFSQPKKNLLKCCSPHSLNVHLTTLIAYKGSKLCFRQAGRRQEWGYKTQGNCWFGLLNSALPKDTKLPIPQWSLPLILLPWSGHIHLKMPAMLLAAKNLLPLKQQEEKKGNNWNDLLLQTASHLLWKWLLFIATERERIQNKYPHCAKFWAFFPNGFGYSTISRRVLYQMPAFVFSNTL